MKHLTKKGVPWLTATKHYFFSCFRCGAKWIDSEPTIDYYGNIQVTIVRSECSCCERRVQGDEKKYVTLFTEEYPKDD